MNNKRQFSKVLAATSAGLALSACFDSELISEKPLLDKYSGRAQPFEPGVYEFCHIHEDGVYGCYDVTVMRIEDKAYQFEFKENGKFLIRFRNLGRAAWLAQAQWTNGEVDEESEYFLLETDNADWIVTSMYCEGAAEDVRTRYAIALELSPMECTVSSRRALFSIAASFYAAGENRPSYSHPLDIFGSLSIGGKAKFSKNPNGAAGD